MFTGSVSIQIFLFYIIYNLCVPITATVGGGEGVGEGRGGPHVQLGVVGGTIGVRVYRLMLISLVPSLLHEGQVHIGCKNKPVHIHH